MCAKHQQRQIMLRVIVCKKLIIGITLRTGPLLSSYGNNQPWLTKICNVLALVGVRTYAAFVVCSSPTKLRTWITGKIVIFIMWEYKPNSTRILLQTTCLDWKPVLVEDRFKNIITDSLEFISNEQRITVYAFVIMNNHFHLIWQIIGDHFREAVQRDFLKFTGQQILKHLKYSSARFYLKNEKDWDFLVHIDG
jgi:REP element-mobilizing transposase RayT